MTMTQARSQLDRNEGVVVIRPHGTMEAQTASRFREDAAAYVGATRVVFDLSQVSFIDSSGLGALIGAIRRIREHGGQPVVCASHRPVARLLQVVGLDRLVAIYPGLDEALAALGAGAGDVPAA